LAVSVALVGPTVRSPQTNEALSRVHGELLSLGFEVTIVERSRTLDQDPLAARGWLERTIAERGVDAVLDVEPSGVEVWIVEAAPGRYDVTRVALDTDSDNASEQLAIRAIEVLRSGLLEKGLLKRGAPAPLPAPPPRIAAREAPSRVHTEATQVGLELGAAALTSLDGVGPAVLPLLRLDWRVRRWLLRASVAGFGTRPTLVGAAGSAQLAQQYGLVGGSYALATFGDLTPSVGLAMGFLRTSVEGHAASPKQGHESEQWSFLVDGSLGTAFELTRRYYLTVAMHVQLAQPYVAIRFIDDAVASSGRPNLLLTCSLGAWL
jgi:hypothetical protein